MVGCNHNSENLKIEEKEVILAKLADIDKWLTFNYWHTSLSNIVWFINVGSSSIGSEIDPNNLLKKYNDEYKKISSHNEFISLLNDKDYLDIKNAWNQMVIEMEKLDDYIQANGVKANSDRSFNADSFTQAKDRFTERINGIL